jgi:hypothetical protein
MPEPLAFTFEPTVSDGNDRNRLVGSEFTIGTVRGHGIRLCEPCTVVDGYASRPSCARSSTAAPLPPTSSHTAIHIGDEITELDNH